jgi:magnesium chelatase family protein
LLDRIDIHVEVLAMSHEKLQSEPEGESTGELRKQVIAAQRLQLERQGCLNKDLTIRPSARSNGIALSMRKRGYC